MGTMSTSEFFVVVGVITALILTSAVVAVLVRFLIKDEPAAAEPDPAEGVAFESIGDFWSGMVPHLLELRNRLVWAFVAIGIGTALGFWLVNSPNVLGKPLPDLMVERLAPGTILQGIDPAEVFVSYMRMALVVGVAFASPVVIYQIVAFFAPGLLPHEKRMVFTALPFISSLFIAGLAFGWYFTVPAALQFLLKYGVQPGGVVVIQPRVDTFIGTVATLLLWNGIIFEMPAIIFLLARLGFVTAKQLARTRRYAIVIITIIAAFITPTGDPFNLMLLAVPMYVLYELGILLARFVPKKKEEAADAGSPAAQAS